MPQTGSGKTYTMGTGYSDNYQTGIIPQVMKALFNKIETLKNQTEVQLHVSFIEVHPLHYLSDCKHSKSVMKLLLVSYMTYFLYISII